MEILGFSRRDLEEVNSWCEKRNVPKFTHSLIPKMGFIVHGVASIFVYATDAGIAIVEGLVSNPDYDASERRKWIRRLVEHAYIEARKQKELVVVIIKNKWVQKLAIDTGYKPLGVHQVFIRG